MRLKKQMIYIVIIF